MDHSGVYLEFVELAISNVESPKLYVGKVSRGVLVKLKASNGQILAFVLLKTHLHRVTGGRLRLYGIGSTLVRICFSRDIRFLVGERYACILNDGAAGIGDGTAQDSFFGRSPEDIILYQWEHNLAKARDHSSHHSHRQPPEFRLGCFALLRLIRIIIFSRIMSRKKNATRKNAQFWRKSFRLACSSHVDTSIVCVNIGSGKRLEPILMAILLETRSMRSYLRWGMTSQVWHLHKSCPCRDFG